MTTAPVPSINDEQLAELESKAQAAMQGPWRAGNAYDKPFIPGYEVICDTDDGPYVILGGNQNFLDDAIRNVAHAAAANPATVLALIATIRQQRAELIETRRLFVRDTNELVAERDNLSAELGRLRAAPSGWTPEIVQGPAKSVFYGGNRGEHLNRPVVLLYADEYEQLRTMRAASAGVPEGWRLVPDEPTIDMGWAYIDAARESNPEKSFTFSHPGYLAMLAAAPAALAPAARAPAAWQYREIGEGGWQDCSMEWFDYCEHSPLYDARKLYTVPPAAAEQPDTVMVPSELLDRAATWLEVHAPAGGCVESDVAQDLRALLARGET